MSERRGTLSRRRFLTASLAGVLVLPVLQACSQPAAAPASKPTAAAPTAPAAKPTEPAKPAATQPPAKPTEPAKPTTGGPLPKTKSGYPERAINIIVPYAAGGGTDIMFRTMDKVAAELKIFPQNFVITNVTGGSGFTGKQQAISRPPDGYTLTVADDSNIFGQILGQAPMKYTDFTYIARMVLDYNMVIVRQDSPFKSLQDWIAAAKAQPKGVTVGGTGIGNNDHVHLANIEKRTGVQFNYISFDSGGQVLTNLLGGQVASALANPGEAYEQIRAGTVRALGVSAPERLKGLPHVPTWREQGVDYVVAQFRGVAGPKGIPADIVAYLEEAFKRVAESPLWASEYLDKYQQVNGYLNSADFQKFVDEYYAETERAFQELESLKTR